jgi:hypothetical protein
MLFSSGRDCSHNFFNLGRVILVVSIPSSSFSSSSSSIISSNCAQLMTPQSLPGWAGVAATQAEAASLTSNIEKYQIILRREKV